MNYQTNILFKILKKLVIWYIIYIFLIFIHIINLNHQIDGISLNEVKIMLGLVGEQRFSTFFMCQLFLFLITFISFFDFEKNNSPEFTKARLSIKIHRRIKLFMMFIFVVLTRLLYFFFIKSLINNALISYKYLLISSIEFIIILFITYILYIIINRVI